MTDSITNSQDTIDSRDVLERIKELQKIRGKDDDDKEELKSLKKLLKELQDNGLDTTDENWGTTLISDDYFEEYAQEFAVDIGAINKNTEWPAAYIDWEAAADALKQDYTQIDFDGQIYWADSYLHKRIKARYYS